MPHRKVSEPKVQKLRAQNALNPQPQEVKDPLFQTDPFFDPRDMVQVKYEMLRRTRVEGWTVTEATQVFGLSRPTFYQAQRAFKASGLQGLRSRKRGPKKAYKLTEKVIAFMEEMQKNDPSMKARALAKAIDQEFNITIHHRSIERALTGKKKHRMSVL